MWRRVAVLLSLSLFVLSLPLRLFAHLMHYSWETLLGPWNPQRPSPAQQTTDQQKNFFLRGNFGPVGDELHAEALPVRGFLPDDLDGMYIRNGPNPHNPVDMEGRYHWFDGDGMLHAVDLCRGIATYRNRYIQTDRLLLERLHKRPLVLRIGEMVGKMFLVRMVWKAVKERLGFGIKAENVPPRPGNAPRSPEELEDTEVYFGSANTSVEFHVNKFFALVESHPPMRVQLPTLETVGAFRYGGKLKHPFTAHPKRDPNTGEMIFFGYQLMQAPFVTHTVVDCRGEFVRDVPVSIPGPVMMHDFAITQHYSILMDLPLEFVPKRVVRDKNAFKFNKNRPSRFGILPRHAVSDAECRWFEAPPCFIFHTANAWEEDDGQTVVLLACKTDKLTLHSLQDAPDAITELTEFRFDLSVKDQSPPAHVRVVAPGIHCEFPTIHPGMCGTPTRYTYCTILKDDDNIGMIGCMKYDALTQKTRKILFGENVFGGECLFVPRKSRGNHSPRQRLLEDDGYLMVFTYHAEEDRSRFVVYDAKRFSDLPLAEVILPRRVPFGFHGKFVTREEINSQEM